MQKEKQENLEKIKEVEKILSETSSQRKNTLGELSALNQRIKQQESLVSNIRSEINLLNKEISETREIIDALEEDLQKLKQEYASMLFSAQKASGSINRLVFLFSSTSFNQMAMRLKYMEQYGDIRKTQVIQIEKVQQTLREEIRIIEERKAEQNQLLAEQTKEIGSLADLRKKQNDVVKNLERQESKLKKDLDEKKKAIARIDKLIDDIVREEIERAARASRTAAAAASAEVAALSNSFAENKSKLPWPANGFVSLGFGNQNLMKGVLYNNEGIWIQTRQGEKVKAVFEGEVRDVAFYPTLGKVVIIKHGDYFTVYAGLKEVEVKKGDNVKTGQQIGDVLSNADGVAELKFQIRKVTTPLDPQAWLRKS
ncbi:MAG TPA: peptidoglycan DD-metalloendopeptidase family protein [Cyclobacteriaceae bacterium]|nr:peptidoglycan DD-metalloendopeptidase family protein [Cyclobacteriaceae bacterium]